jgi:protein-tyrosine-phosphatase
MAHRVLFACVENANRSQMAEAFARMHGAGMIEPASAGSRPAGTINPAAVAAMAERGYDLGSHRARSLADAGPGPWDYVVTMGCGDECPYVPAVARFDWDVQDPSGLPPADFARVRDEIEHRVLDLLRHIRATDTPSPE